jgi:hypothetical protein
LTPSAAPGERSAVTMRSLRPASQCEAHGNCPIRPPIGAAPPSATGNTNLSSLDPAIG